MVLELCFPLILGRKTDTIVAPNLCPFKEKIIEELNAAKAQEKALLLENKMGETDEQTKSDAMALVKLVEDAQNRARGLGPTSEEMEKIAVHEKMESASLAKEFKKVIFCLFARVIVFVGSFISSYILCG